MIGFSACDLETFESTIGSIGVADSIFLHRHKKESGMAKQLQQEIEIRKSERNADAIVRGADWFCHPGRQQDIKSFVLKRPVDGPLKKRIHNNLTCICFDPVAEAQLIDKLSVRWSPQICLTSCE